jgi:hypothetical protein
VIPLAVEFATSQGGRSIADRYLGKSGCKYWIEYLISNCFTHNRDLYNWEVARPAALDAYEKVKDQWMYVCAYTVGKDLHVVQ